MGIKKGIRRLEKWVENQIGNYVDPKEAFLGPDGDPWNPIGGGKSGVGYSLQELPPYRTTAELMRMRVIGKYFAYHNGYAQNGYQSRINYIVGEGHTYAVEKRNRRDKNEGPVTRVTEFIEKWAKLNKWVKRQSESQLRSDRDGELFFRFFYPDDGYLRVRYVEPAAIAEPPEDEKSFEFDDTFGIRTHLDDVETPEAYWVQYDGAATGGEWVPASQMQHRKFNVDCSLKRGVPLFWGIRHSLDRCMTILKSNSMAIQIQTAIAMIRKHKSSKQATQAFISAKANQELSLSQPGKTENVFSYAPGSILDSSANMEYDFPSIGADPEKSVKALQAELRHVAVSIQMPEYMFTGDASNNNRASSDTAETPSMKRFTRDQGCTISEDLEIIEAALEFAVDMGQLDRSDVDAVRVIATAPEVQPRDKLTEAKVRQVDMGLKILSPQTAAAEAGRIYENEQSNIESHDDRTGDMFGLSESQLFDD